ncbi:hypothetical protein HZB00_02245 [Candidatus Woesearchaeota archaeon]|nr:hypothetical protein [Candidatus Woesearchaeota archaeon]
MPSKKDRVTQLKDINRRLRKQEAVLKDKVVFLSESSKQHTAELGNLRLDYEKIRFEYDKTRLNLTRIQGQLGSQGLKDKILKYASPHSTPIMRLFTCDGPSATGKTEFVSALYDLFVIIGSGELLYLRKGRDFDPMRAERDKLSMSSSFLSDRARELFARDMINTGRRLSLGHLINVLSTQLGYVLLNRYIYTTLYHQVAVGGSPLEVVASMEESYVLPRKAILFYCDPKELQKRISISQRIVREGRNPDDPKLTEHHLNAIKDLAPQIPNAYFLDVTTLTPREVVERTLSEGLKDFFGDDLTGKLLDALNKKYQNK